MAGRPLEESYQRDLNALRRLRDRLTADPRIENKEFKDAIVAGIDFVFHAAHLAPTDMDLAAQALNKKYDSLTNLMTLFRRPKK